MGKGRTHRAVEATTIFEQPTPTDATCGDLQCSSPALAPAVSASPRAALAAPASALRTRTALRLPSVDGQHSLLRLRADSPGTENVVFSFPCFFWFCRRFHPGVSIRTTNVAWNKQQPTRPNVVRSAPDRLPGFWEPTVGGNPERCLSEMKGSRSKLHFFHRQAKAK